MTALRRRRRGNGKYDSSLDEWRVNSPPLVIRHSFAVQPPFNPWEALSRFVGVHVRAQDGVDAGLVAGVLAEPAEQVGIEAHGHDFFWGGHDDLGVLPEGSIGRAGVGVGEDGAAYLGRSLAAQAVPVGAGRAFAGRSVIFRPFANSGGVRAARSATPR